MCTRRADEWFMVNDIDMIANWSTTTKNIIFASFLISVAEPSITKDNPAFSMINDSDEDVIYGSDDESRRPLNASTGKANDYDSD